jgi:hypothetical protein
MLGLGCWYYIADYVPMPDGLGFTPALPDGTGFVLLAGLTVLYFSPVAKDWDDVRLCISD